jgi:hemerythrin-like domain-containing protein
LKPTDLLMAEHRLIERMIALLEDALQAMRDTNLSSPSRPNDRANMALITTGVDFFQNYADRTHHGKEEDVLFKALADKPLSDPERQMMQRLMQEHAWTRQAVGRLASANVRYNRGDQAAMQTMIYETGKLVQFYPAHIEKEDLHFFPAVSDYFSNAEQLAMANLFVEFDSRQIHERYARILEEEERRRRVPRGSIMA